MNENDELIDAFKKKLSADGKTENNTRYQYSHVDLEFVISNPSEYIIPECLPACEVLWSKNIETFMVSNNEDNNLYILLSNLSEANESFFKKMMSSDSRFIFSNYRKVYGIAVNGKDESAIKELIALANMLHLQDTKRFKTGEEYLAEFKTQGGEYEIDEYGHIIMRENPKLTNTTLEEALKQDGKEHLYVKEENRVYDSEMYLNWHKRYLQILDDYANRLEMMQQSSNVDAIKNSEPKI